MAFSSHGDKGEFKQGKHQKLLVSEEINLIASSDPANGATNISSDGSQFTVQLQDGIKIPKNAHNVHVSLQEATVWWVVPNIITGVNDKLYITAPRASDDALTAYVITLEQGLYDLTALNEAVLRELENAAAKTNPSTVINILSDNATQKVEFRYNYVGIEIDFTQADTFRDILGFNSQTLGPNATAPLIYLADNVAAFNTINSFLIHSDLVSRGIRLNNSYNQTLGQVLIDKAPGSQIVSTPFNPPKVSADELAGAIKSTLRFWLTDQANQPVNTNSEFWTGRVSIKYQYPVWI